MTLTKQELLAKVAVHEINDLLIVKLINIPNPYRSEFAADMYYATRPLIEGEAWCFYAHDWSSWVRGRYKKDYAISMPSKYVELSDDDVLHEPMTDELWDKIVKEATNDKVLYIEKCENGVFIKYGDVVYWERNGQVLFKHSKTYVQFAKFLVQLNSIFESLKIVEKIV